MSGKHGSVSVHILLLFKQCVNQGHYEDNNIFLTEHFPTKTKQKI